MEIQVDIIEEPERGCGSRHSGPDGLGLYLVGQGIPMQCDRLPMPLGTCDTCGHTIGHSRGFTWINPQKLFSHDKPPKLETCEGMCSKCPMGNLKAVGDKAGLMWVGRKFYTPKSFSDEMFTHPNGVCKRINELPSDFVLGKHIIYLAHVDAIEVWDEDEGETVTIPGVFSGFKPMRLEGVIDDANTIPQRAIAIKDKYGDLFRIVQIKKDGGSADKSGDDGEN